MTKELYLILSSSFLSGVFSASAEGFFALRTKQNEYANDYYKTVVSRRLQAYENVETLNLKMSVLDTDMLPYHPAFSGAILLFENRPGDGNWVQFGKEHYTQLAELVASCSIKLRRGTLVCQANRASASAFVYCRPTA